MRPVSKGEVTVVLPTLNEEEAIGQVIDELRGEGYGNILVVDGYSRDRTVEIAGGRRTKRRPPLKLFLEEKPGYADNQ